MENNVVYKTDIHRKASYLGSKESLGTSIFFTYSHSPVICMLCKQGYVHLPKHKPMEGLLDWFVTTLDGTALLGYPSSSTRSNESNQDFKGLFFYKQI